MSDTQKAVFKAIGRGKRTVLDIQNVTGFASSTIRRALSFLLSTGDLTSTEVRDSKLAGRPAHVFARA